MDGPLESSALRVTNPLDACHSERSEESLLDLTFLHESKSPPERSFGRTKRDLRMTGFWGRGLRMTDLGPFGPEPQDDGNSNYHSLLGGGGEGLD